MIGRLLQLRNINTGLIRPEEIARKMIGSAEISQLDEYENVWRKWFANRKQYNHVIVNRKCSGALTGLFVLQSCLASGRGPAYFIVPRPHMIPAIVQKAHLLGIKAVNSEDGSLKQDFSKIQVASIRNAFRNIRGTGIVFVDDAGDCAAEAINMYSLNIPSYSSLYSEISDLLCGRRPSAGDDACDVSRAKWIASCQAIRMMLQEYKEFDSLYVRIDSLDDMLEKCTCTITNESVMIAPAVIDPDKTGIIASSRHRVFFVSQSDQIKKLAQAFGNPKEQ
jgi:hypothetical protein